MLLELVVRPICLFKTTRNEDTISDKLDPLEARNTLKKQMQQTLLRHVSYIKGRQRTSFLCIIYVILRMKIDLSGFFGDSYARNTSELCFCCLLIEELLRALRGNICGLLKC